MTSLKITLHMSIDNDTNHMKLNSVYVVIRNENRIELSAANKCDFRYNSVIQYLDIASPIIKLAIKLSSIMSENINNYRKCTNIVDDELPDWCILNRFEIM